jgi:predicted nucleic acid-binding protein
MSFLIDTDTCSAHFKGNALVTNRFLQYSGNLHISVVTLGELYTWALRTAATPKRLQDILDLLNDVHILEATTPIARKFGEIRAGLMDHGLPTPDLDLLNAATALEHNFTVVTHNVADYQNVPGLRLDDWLVP